MLRSCWGCLVSHPVKESAGVSVCMANLMLTSRPWERSAMKNDWYENDTLYTDDKGAYQLIRSVFESPNDVKIVFEDIDGEENGGEYMSSEATPEVKRTKKGDNSWYGGAFEVQADVKLKKK